METQSYTKSVEKNWTELKGKIKSKWSKFSDEEVESIKSDLNQLTGKVQKVYGVAKENAERQYDEFKTSVKSLLDQDASSEVKKVISVSEAPKASEPQKSAEPAPMKSEKPTDKS